MSSAIWTPAELSSNAKPLRAEVWRAVEAQHRVSTAKITDTLAEQERLEQVIDKTKPLIPAECGHLSYLLSTPFRYGAVYPKGSRFRQAGMTLGVFYAAEIPKTSIIEIAFYRVLFFAESPKTPWPKNAGEYTAFATQFETETALDLSAAPLDRHSSLWKDPVDYSACQALADDARRAGIQVIKYESVRSPQETNFAILTCRVFTKPDAVAWQTWRIHLSSSGVRIFCEMPQASFDLPPSIFDSDPRTKGMSWDR